MDDENAMCGCGRERIAKGCSVNVKLRDADVSWGICYICGQELERGEYPKKKED